MSNVFFVHLQFFFVEFFFFFKLIEQIFFYSPIFSFSARHTSQNHRSHHSITPWWIYRIPSELRSQAPLGPISTAVGDHAGILGVECFFFGADLWRILGISYLFFTLFFCFNPRLCGIVFFSLHTLFGRFAGFHCFFSLRIQRMQNAPPNRGKKKEKKNKPANQG